MKDKLEHIKNDESNDNYLNTILDATFRIKVTPDKMKATIIITRPEGGGKDVTYQQIIDTLKNEEVIFGIDKNVVETISKVPIYQQEIIIATGKEPIRGENGKMNYHFNITKDRLPKIRIDGTVDFRELDLIENVNEEDILVTLIPPTIGEPGKNIFGREIPPVPGKPAILPKGKNVKVSEDGKQLIAEINGQVVLKDRKVSVYGLYEVLGNIDNSTGNIKFIGNVTIKGNVQTGFSIEAGGTVEVLGVVEGATIKAAGDIVLHRGMQGLGKGVLISEGNIVARYIENSSIIAKGDIECEAIMHSHIQCGRRLQLSGRKGLIVGGWAKVGYEISAKNIGSPMATVTDLEVGIDPNLRMRYKQLKDEINLLESNLKKASQAIELLKKLEDLNKLSGPKKLIKIRSIKTKLHISKQLEVLRKEFYEIEQKVQYNDEGKVIVSRVMYQGTKVTIGSSSINIKENIENALLYRDGASIRIGQL